MRTLFHRLTLGLYFFMWSSVFLPASMLTPAELLRFFRRYSLKLQCRHYILNRKQTKEGIYKKRDKILVKTFT